MNLSALKTFAPEVRRQLMEAVGRKLDFVLNCDTADLRAAAAQVANLRSQAEANRTALIERVAYTWFNRLAALRFIDAHPGWHPFRCRVVTPASAEETQPEILKLTRSGALPPELAPFIDAKRVNDLLDGHLPSLDPQGEVYRHLILAACRFYHNLMPFLFEALDDETELLLPDDLLTEHSIAYGFRSDISDEDCQEVELIGWLYQFYISEKKDQVMARKSAVPAEDIPAVTQLFTPHWIVRYLVENSLGRLWLRSRPSSRLREHMPYYVDDPEGQTPPDCLTVSQGVEIKLLDPACGSGHMLTYSFDLLFRIYEEEGHAPSDIPGLILSNNLYGLDICPRAVQLAQFALVCKAREKSRSAFRNPIQPQVMCLEDVNITLDDMTVYIRLTGFRELFAENVLRQVHQFRENTPAFGSLVQPILSLAEIVQLKSQLASVKPIDDLEQIHAKVLRALDQAEMLCQRYQVVIANPPYMGSNKFNAQLKLMTSAEFKEGKADLYSCFLLRNLRLLLPKGLNAMITLPNWMFLGSWEDLRKKILASFFISSLIHNGRGLWGSDFGSCAFVIETSPKPDAIGFYKRLFAVQGEVNSPEELENRFLDNRSNPPYLANSRRFLKIPGQPIAYWVSERVANLFKAAPPLGSVAKPRQGLATGDNEQFLRDWWEPSISRVGFGLASRDLAMRSGKRWFPCNKGGAFRKWYGNYEFVVDWENDGERIRNFFDDDGKLRSRPQNIDYSFKEGMTWSTVTISRLSMRLSPLGQMFETKGSVCFFDSRRQLEYGLAFANTAIVEKLLLALSPTADYHEGPLGKLPFIVADADRVSEIAQIAISIARADWDNFETSWDFCNQPLLRPGLKGATLEASWQNWKAQSFAAIRRMQELETENNRLFIGSYGLSDELAPEVPEEQITLARADRRKDMAAFLSYAVGCMMGRYSLDAPGLILANAGDTLELYFDEVGKPLDQLSFVPDEDGIIPILDGEWFEDDIVARTRDFLRATFGDATLEANIHFIEESLGKDLRKYFLTDFYRDHLQTYKKRPIYWLFQSPKKGFNALVYLHRYTKDTPNRVLGSYLRDFLHKLRSRLEHLDHLMALESTPTREVTKARKESDQIKKTLRECEEYEREILLPLAQKRIELDLDDGVKVNYLKLGQALAPIPGLAAKEED